MDDLDELVSGKEFVRKVRDCSTCRHWAVGDVPGRCQNLALSVFRAMTELPRHVKNWGCASWEEGE